MLVSLVAWNTASAGPFQPKTIPAEAKFVGFVDLEAGRQTALGDRLLSILRKLEGYQKFEDFMVSVAGFMPESDIKDLTVYGTRLGDDNDGLILMRAAFDRAKIEQVLTNAEGYKTEKHDDRTVLTWIDTDSRKEVFACVVDAQTIYMGGEKRSLMLALDVLDDVKKAMPENSSLIKAPSPGTWAFAGATEISSAPDSAQNPVFRSMRDARFEISQVENNTRALLSVLALDAERAKQLAKLGDGALAFFLMNTEADPKNPKDPMQNVLAELAPLVKITQEGSEVFTGIEIKNDALDLLIDKVDPTK